MTIALERAERTQDMTKAARLERSTELTIRRADAPSPVLRRFEARGEDEAGLVHSFHTDCEQLAGDIAEILRWDLSEVRVDRHAARA